MRNITLSILAGLLYLPAITQLPAQVRQQALSRVDQMPNLPQPLEIIDYRKLAIDFDRTVFDFNATGKYWPLVWIDSSYKNYRQPVVLQRNSTRPIPS